MLKSNVFTLLLIGWLITITSLSLVSLTLDTGLPIVRIPGIDKVVHCVFYGVAFLLGVFAIREPWRHLLDFKTTAFIIGVGMFFYGTIIEVIQEFFTYWRSGDWRDMIANLSGILIGYIALSVLFSGKGRLKWKD